jgi:chemotaxis protein methyltransferase CheR
MIEARFGIGQHLQRDRLAAFLATRTPPEQALLAARLAQAGDDDPAWQALIEAMLVHETYFYRHPDQLDVLSREAVPYLRRAQGGAARRLSVWCAGCATGEEAFTLAFLLRDANCPARIVATDLSADSVAIGRAGRYRRGPGLNSFRAMPPEGWRHFDAVPGEPDMWAVSDSVARDVEFVARNLMTPHPPGFVADLISCRNVLLYFGAHGLRQAEEALLAASRPGTVLMLGPAERLRSIDVFVPLSPSSTQILHWPLSHAPVADRA